MNWPGAWTGREQNISLNMMYTIVRQRVTQTLACDRGKRLAKRGVLVTGMLSQEDHSRASCGFCNCHANSHVRYHQHDESFTRPAYGPIGSKVHTPRRP